MTNIPSKKLNDEVSIPVIGYGTWQLVGKECRECVNHALEFGYRHLDTATFHSNHELIGLAIKDSKIPREEIFITSKVWKDHLKKEQVGSSIKNSIEVLKSDYLDLCLIHWPNKEVPIKETLEAMAKAKEEGLIKAIGVSNFTIDHLEDALETGVEISNNQVEYHPSLNQKDLKEYCDEKGITLTAYSPLGRGVDLVITEVQDLAEKYQKSRAQIILNWLVHKGLVVIPKSSNEGRIKENLESLDFEMDEKDHMIMDGLGRNNRIIKPMFAEFYY